MSGSLCTTPKASPINELATLLNCRWANIDLAQQKTDQVLQRLSGVIEDVPAPAPDTSIVVNGSLARYECTDGSDLDWTLLVDSEANADHQEILLGIANALTATNSSGTQKILHEIGLKDPGPEGTFGTLAFSQPLIHYIGGENDSNSNTTRRVLLLLEAMPIGKHRQAFDRVRKNILKRYLDEDRGLFHKSLEGNQRWIPLFLLNDFSRYWRTMAVDFAYKQFNRGNKGYALRSIKLGTSRKLLFASGLLSCFWCDPSISGLKDQELKIQSLIDGLESFLNWTPLERFAKFFMVNADSAFLNECARDLFDSYDSFLGLLNDKEKRDRLEKLAPEEEESSPVFDVARRIRHDFRLAILKTFTAQDSPLRDLSIGKGIF